MTTAITSPVGPISVLETYVASPLTVSMTPGLAYRVLLKGTVQSNVEVQPTFNLRMGTAGTLADAVVASVSPFVNPYNLVEPFEVEFVTTVQSATQVAASGVVYGNGNAGVIGITETNAVSTATGSTKLGASVIGVVTAVDQATITTGSPAISLASTGPIYNLGYVTGGTLYTPTVGTATYNGVALTGGSGSGATGNVTVTNGAVTQVVLVNPGVGYTAGDQLSAVAATIGGTGSGFSDFVSTVVGGPQNIGLVGINNPIAFATTVGTPGGQVVAGTVYYIVAANVGTSGLINQIEVSAMAGGTPIVFNASGSTKATLAYDCVLNVTQAICSAL